LAFALRLGIPAQIDGLYVLLIDNLDQFALTTTAGFVPCPADDLLAKIGGLLKALGKPLNLAAAVDDTLRLTGEERVTGAAHVRVQLGHR
jgi:hypothetical protein